MPKRSVACNAIALILAVACGAATAQTAPFPTHVIRLIVPYEPGGGVDIMGRLVAKGLGDEIGQSIVVENHPGAGGAVGTQVLASAKPDGYTLELASTSPIAIVPYLVKNLGYSPERDLAPISLVANVPALLLVSNKAPFKDFADLIAQAKASPGKFTYSSSGIGGTGHLAAQLLKQSAGIELLHVPYKGTGSATTAVIGGDVNMTFSDIVSGMKYAQSGQLRALAITGPARSSVLPNVPTIADTVPGYSAGVWYAVFAPAKTPPAIIDALNKALVRATKKDIAVSLIAQGVEPIGSTPAELAAFVKEEQGRWSKVIKDSDMKPE
jgi:tripartite-type tricarboxylate transporter receptor subunit TctC